VIADSMVSRIKLFGLVIGRCSSEFQGNMHRTYAATPSIAVFKDRRFSEGMI